MDGFILHYYALPQSIHPTHPTHRMLLESLNEAHMACVAGNQGPFHLGNHSLR